MNYNEIDIGDYILTDLYRLAYRVIAKHEDPYKIWIIDFKDETSSSIGKSSIIDHAVSSKYLGKKYYILTPEQIKRAVSLNCPLGKAARKFDESL